MEDVCYPGKSSRANLPESPRAPMEFLSRSWSASALEVSKALAPPSHLSASSSSCSGVASKSSSCTTSSIPEEINGESEELLPFSSLNQFSFASSSTSQLVLDRIMTQSAREEVSPLTSGRLSHSSGPLNCGSLTETDSPPISPPDDFDDVVKFFRANHSIQPLFANGRVSAVNNPGTGSNTVKRWLKERKEKKKEESRAQNAQLHAAISVAAVAAAVASIAAATAASSSTRKKDQSTKTDVAMASAAALVAAQCVEAAEAMGAERDHLASIINSAVNVRSHDDITTLTAAAATALRGAATLKARALKEAWSISAVIPVEKGIGVCGKRSNGGCASGEGGEHEELLAGLNVSGLGFQDFLARGSELLKRTRKGDLHWKVVSVYIHRTGQVMLKMKSRHVAGTITKKKKNVVLEVYKDIPAWPGRHLFSGGEQRHYFGLKTESRGIVEFECNSQRDYDMWIQGVSRLLQIVAERRNHHRQTR